MMPNLSEHTQNTHRLERLERELDGARRISQALFQHLDLEELVQHAHHIALEVVDAQAGCVLLAKPETKELIFYHSIGEKAPPVGTAFPWDQGIAGSVFQTGEPIITRDATEDDRHFNVFDQRTGHTTHDMIALPLKRWEGDPIGVMEIMNKRRGRLNEEDVSILTIISAMTAISIEEARLFEEAKLAEVVRVLGDIGHDVKNLLMPVLCGAGLLQTEVDEVFAALAQVDKSKANASHQMCTEVIEMLRNNARRIQDRVKEIADCVKGLSSPPNFAPCRVSEVIKGVIETLRFVAEEKHITLTQENLHTLPPMDADERRLFNAFYNLVNNAISEVPPGGSVIISGKVDSTGKNLHLAVSDTGRGMPAEIRDSLFTAKAVSKKAGGTGLGTKIIKDVIDAHGGHISVDSEVGIGSVFNIRLPLTSSNPGATAKEKICEF